MSSLEYEKNASQYLFENSIGINGFDYSIFSKKIPFILVFTVKR